MINWKDYVGLFPESSVVFYLDGNKILKQLATGTMNECQIGHAVESMLQEFPFCSSSDPKRHIRLKSKRGAGNIEFLNTVMYMGISVFDRAILVAQNSDGKYCAVKHPNFLNFGVTIV